MSDLPKISIVTPSYNQGEFLEQTICSVLDQNYPNLEYFVVDGGSTDQSVEIIKKYASQLTWWVSEKDNGQSHAINKGFARASGTIYGWINSDDYYLPGAFKVINEMYQQNPEAIAWVASTQVMDRAGKALEVHIPWGLSGSQLANFGIDGHITQPGCLFSGIAFQQVGCLIESYHYTMDVDLWVKLNQVGDFHSSPKPVACARVYPGVKTQADPATREAEVILICYRNGYPDVVPKRMQHWMDYFYALGQENSLQNLTLPRAIVTLIKTRLAKACKSMKPGKQNSSHSSHS